MHPNPAPQQASSDNTVGDANALPPVHTASATPAASDPGKQRNAKPKSSPGDSVPEREFGEGNYKAARDCDMAAEKFAKSGKVPAAAAAAKPRNPEEAAAMERAEAERLSHNKGVARPSVPQKPATKTP